MKFLTGPNKTGFLTSEFWLAVASLFLMNSGTEISEQEINTTAQAGSAFVAGLYAIGRAVKKAFSKGE